MLKRQHEGWKLQGECIAHDDKQLGDIIFKRKWWWQQNKVFYVHSAVPCTNTKIYHVPIYIYYYTKWYFNSSEKLLTDEIHSINPSLFAIAQHHIQWLEFYLKAYQPPWLNAKKG